MDESSLRTVFYGTLDISTVRVPRHEGSERDAGHARLNEIELILDQSGSTRSSRDQPEARHYCRESGCKSSFKRKYDIDRHYQAKHVQSKNFFCPVHGCHCSAEPNIARYYFSGSSRDWVYPYRTLKSELVVEDYDNGFRKYLLYGFHRKDKLLEHVAKSHEGLGVDLSSLLEGKDACRGNPMVAETQRFCVNIMTPRNLGYEILGRYQRRDGSWTAWSGTVYNAVAEMGFKAWMKPDKSSSIKEAKTSCEAYQSSHAATDALTQASASGSMVNAGAEMMQLSQGHAMLPFTAELPFGHFPASSTSQFAVNSHDQGLWSSSQQLDQTELFFGNENRVTCTADSYGLTRAVSATTNDSVVFTGSNIFSTETMAPMPTTQLAFDITGVSGKAPDCSNMSFGDTLMDLDTSLDIVYASAKPDQTASEDFYTGGAEYLDSLIDFDFDFDFNVDAATWSPDDASQRY